MKIDREGEREREREREKEMGRGKNRNLKKEVDNYEALMLSIVIIVSK